ncbi:protein RCC2-like [Styela clava]|uniref:protein RCC2-like n=1 Tax=Styela clava TaxID=7725 RepID=UPI00193AC811|nr:protein RCC2-like [Styela clava]XP_039250914.1 protein RCC2-like [Styela clava]
MPRRKNDPSKLETESPDEKRIKQDLSTEDSYEDDEVDVMKIPLPTEEGELVITGGLNWSTNGRRKPKKGDEKFANIGRNLYKPHRYKGYCGIKVAKIISGCTANHNLAISKEGKLYSWGRNEFGQLGHGDTDRYDLPKQVESLSHLKIVNAAVGKSHTLCLTDSGKVYAFGENTQGQLGIGKQSSYVPSPTQVNMKSFVVDISCGGEFSMIVDIDGYVYSFGCPEYGQLGNNTDGKYFVASNKLSFDSVSSPFRIPLWREKTRSGQVIPVQDVKVIKVECGNNHTIALDSKKRIFTWGFGGYGRLGHSEQKDEQTPRLVEAFNRENRGATRIFAGSTFSLAINESGMTMFWGLQGTISSRETTMYPKPVQDLTGWNVKSLGCGSRHIAVSADDNVIVWGIGTSSGELGLGEQRKSSANPLILKAMEGLSVLEVACGQIHTIFKVRNDSEQDEDRLKQLPLFDSNNGK